MNSNKEIKPEPEGAVEVLEAEIVESSEKLGDLKIINKYYIVSLVLNNVVEQNYLFIDLIRARNKFVDMCREFSIKWRETDIDLALEQEFWKIENGSVNINSPVYL